MTKPNVTNDTTKTCESSAPSSDESGYRCGIRLAPQPVRLQRSRKKGAKLESPNGLPVACVTRPREFGNPFVVGGHYMRGSGGSREFAGFSYVQASEGYQDERFTTIQTASEAVDWFRWYVDSRPDLRERACRELRGKNLACWCKLDSPCHADVLLEIANRSPSTEGSGR